jgi:hypothetical protein
MPQEYESWLDKVADALRSINMNMGDWQPVWPYDFKSEYDAGTAPDAVAMKANRFWWREQNRSLNEPARRYRAAGYHAATKATASPRTTEEITSRLNSPTKPLPKGAKGNQ